MVDSAPPPPLSILQRTRLREVAPSFRTLRLRRRTDPLAPWYQRDSSKLDFSIFGPCESCGKEYSFGRECGGVVQALCENCDRMRLFAGLDLEGIKTPAVEVNGVVVLPENWHRAALPSQQAAHAAYRAALAP